MADHDRRLSPEILEQTLKDLADFVIEASTTPMNSLSVAALLESRGLRDVDAIEMFGRRHIFDLADEVFGRTIEKVKEKEVLKFKGFKTPLTETIKYFFVEYLGGFSFAVPMIGQVAAIFVLKYSLWSWLKFSNTQASLVAIGTIVSFIISGGLIQVLGREGVFYLGQKNPLFLEKICNIVLKTGLLGMAGFCLSVVFLNLIFPYFKFFELVIMFTYFNLLTLMWLVLAMIYVLANNFFILATTVLGTGFVFIVMELTNNKRIYMAHITGITVTFLSSLLIVKLILKRQKRDADKKFELIRLPRLSILFYIVEPFMIFGMLYFSLLFTDRLIGWSASDTRLPLIVWFRTPYELGMDWAMMALILIFPILNFTVNRFNKNLVPTQQNTAATNYKSHNQSFMEFYKRQNILIAIISLISIFVVYYGLIYFNDTMDIPKLKSFVDNPICHFTYWFSAIGYALLAFGQLNSLFFFSLAKPAEVNPSIFKALILNILVGYLLSRGISYEYSVVGFTAGSGYYAYLMTRKSINMIKNLDYNYYSAF